MPRTTDSQINLAFVNLARSMRVAKIIGNGPELTLHRGNSQYKITNKLILNNTELWRGMAGYSKKECLAALEIMRMTVELPITYATVIEEAL